jgi:hypothetical protein
MAFFVAAAPEELMKVPILELQPNLVSFSPGQALAGYPLARDQYLASSKVRTLDVTTTLHVSYHTMKEDIRLGLLGGQRWFFDRREFRLRFFRTLFRAWIENWSTPPPPPPTL